MNSTELATTIITLAKWNIGTVLLQNTSNTTNTTAPPMQVDDGRDRLTLTEVAIMSTAKVILIIVILFGNFLVLGIFYQYTPLRTVTNYYIVSLANADLLVALLSIPIWIAYLQVNLAKFNFGVGLYRFWICLDITSGVSSVLNLSFVSVDRYVHITKPLHYHTIMTSTRAKIVIICIWMYAIGLALIKGIAYSWQRPNYEILVFVMGFLLPFSVMGWCYFKIFGEARIHARALNDLDTVGNRDRKKQFKAAKTIAVVILAFFICWCPFFTLNLAYGLHLTWAVPKALITVSKWLHYTNSALNPIIYACFNQEYRSAFRALLTRKRYQSERVAKKPSSTKTACQKQAAQDNCNFIGQNGHLQNIGLVCRQDTTNNSLPSKLDDQKLEMFGRLQESTV